MTTTSEAVATINVNIMYRNSCSNLAARVAIVRARKLPTIAVAAAAVPNTVLVDAVAPLASVVRQHRHSNSHWMPQEENSDHSKHRSVRFVVANSLQIDLFRSSFSFLLFKRDGVKKATNTTLAACRRWLQWESLLSPRRTVTLTNWGKCPLLIYPRESLTVRNFFGKI